LQPPKKIKGFPVLSRSFPFFTIAYRPRAVIFGHVLATSEIDSNRFFEMPMWHLKKAQVDQPIAPPPPLKRLPHYAVLVVD
jgi:hypothetical protein